jgi:energy-coupling factor transport system permease protein
MSYRRRASALHAARAAAALAWCAGLGLAAIISAGPLPLGALFVALLAAAALAGVWRELRRALIWAVLLALTVCVVNALVTRDGTTVIWRFGYLPLFGDTNVTLEATVYGAVLGLRAALLVLIGALYSLAVDPDEVLMLLRRWAPHSALTATIATRLVPVLIRDSRRLAEAQRCRPGPAPGRLALMRAATAGVLDRALDVAAVLEVRGFALAGRGAGRRDRPWSLQDIAFTAAGATLVPLAVLIRVAGITPFGAYPTLVLGLGARTWLAAAALATVALAPFALRRGIVR